MHIDLFVYAVRTTSGNKISKKKKLVQIRTIWCAFFKKKSLYRENEGVRHLLQSQILSHAKLAKNAIFHVIYSSGAGVESFFLLILPYPPLRFLDPTKGRGPDLRFLRQLMETNVKIQRGS
jgi:hypothetical protein